ncbi:beta strand repeat-containing protein [Inquilinus sp. YAF38]|uniref:beta strand repeat-containing protein n=1 Tax=Inquilinus sp. YAF38 TaxID=3233084 RepID=UPI003F930A54
MAVVNGTAGADLIHNVGDGLIAPPGFTDIAQATDNDDTLSGLGGTDAIYGGGGNDLIDGGDGNDSLIGGAGADTLLGGAGIDLVSYGGATGVLVSLNTGHGIGGDAEGDVLNGIENVHGTAFGDSITGSAAANTLTGLGGSDLLHGQDGNDMLDGGDGGDNLHGENGNDTVSGGAGDDTITGDAGADHLDGGAGSDILNYDGPAGVTVDLSTGLAAGGDAQGDVISGFENVWGNNVHGDIITGSSGANLLDGWGGDDVLGGGAGDDQLLGDHGDDVLRGGAGADVLDGGDGIDLVTFYGATVAVTVNLSSGVGGGGDAQGDTYVAIENVNGGKGADAIEGSTAANVLNGYEGHDTIYGGDGDDTVLGGAGDDQLEGDAGADRIDGGAGIDTVNYDGSTGVTVDLGTGLGSGGEAQGDTLSGIENAWGTGIYDDILTGSAAANRLEGFGGNDVLAGMGGADTLIGGADDDTLHGGDGDDFLHVGDGADVMDGGAGRDTIVFDRPMVADWQSGVLDADISTDAWQNWEVIQGSSGNDTIRTNSWGYAVELRGGAGDDVLAAGVNDATADTLSGEAGNDRLDGGPGDDVLRGGAGADVLVGSAGTDTASYYTGTTGILVSLASGTGSGGEAQGDTLSGIENLSGSQGGDSLYGSAGANVLQGWNGNDTLVGRAGQDTLSGGAGADRFQFTALGDSVIGADADRITDFSHAQGDRIDLAGIDANVTVAGDQAFSFIGTAVFTHVAGQLHIWHDAGQTILSGDVNGNGTADFNIVLSGTVAPVAGDFVL